MSAGGPRVFSLRQTPKREPGMKSHIRKPAKMSSEARWRYRRRLPRLKPLRFLHMDLSLVVGLLLKAPMATVGG
jgi:hypothetical protein